MTVRHDRHKTHIEKRGDGCVSEVCKEKASVFAVVVKAVVVVIGIGVGMDV